MTTFRNILCAVDFSEGAREAMRVACELSQDRATALTLMHVFQMPAYAAAAGSTETIELLLEEAQRALGDWKAQAEALGAARVGTRFSVGAPWHEIVAAAESEPRTDLIVVGTHGRTGIAHALLGSVAERVVRHAQCPVLVTRAHE
jgi:nucleotide-binding universal stress UspA family protein